MVALATTTISANLLLQRNPLLLNSHVTIVRQARSSITFSFLHNESKFLLGRLSFSSGSNISKFVWPICAVGAGLEASITDQKKNDIALDNVKIVIESRDDDEIHVRVDLTGEETQSAFDEVLTNLASTAPPIPGFRRKKGGKTSNVPKSFLLQMLGKDRVTKFLIQEVISTTMADFVKKEQVTVKSQFKTIQTAEELESAFTPGKEFGFNATLEIVKSDSEESTADSEESSADSKESAADSDSS